MKPVIFNKNIDILPVGNRTSYPESDIINPTSKSEIVQPTVKSITMKNTFKNACTIPSVWYDLAKAQTANIACAKKTNTGIKTFYLLNY
jgi:predicted secreted protein